MRGHEVYRLSCGPSLLGVDIKRYTVHVGSWERTFVVMPAMYGAHLFLITNKYGMLVPFEGESVAMDGMSEGENVLVNGRYGVALSGYWQSYRCRTTALTKEESRVIGQANRGEKCYEWVDGMWKEIVVEIGSVNVYDEGEDMMVVEFGYRFADNQVENRTGREIEESGMESGVIGDAVIEESFIVS